MAEVRWGSLGVLVGAGSVSLALAACGGSTPEPQTPDPGADYVEAPSPEESESEESSGDELSEAPTEDNVVISTQDFQDAMQIVLDDEALKTGIELEQPGRFPLKIAGGDIPSGVMVTCVGEAAEVIALPEDPKATPVLYFVSIEFNGTMGVFKYRHDAAGIRGTTKVKRTDGRWELMSSRVNDYGGMTQ